MNRFGLDRVHLALIAAIALLFILLLFARNPVETVIQAPPPSITTTTVEVSAPASLTVAEPGATLRRVTDRGALRCGVRATTLPGFLEIRDGLPVSGFDYEFCRALAAAVLGDADAVQFVGLSTGERFDALHDREGIDVLIRTTTWTSGRDVRFEFGPTTFHDGQQLIGPRVFFNSRSDVDDIDGFAVCVAEASTSFDRIAELIRSRGLDTDLITLDNVHDAVSAMQAGECEAVTGDGSALQLELADRGMGSTWVVFPDVPFSKEPLGPVVRSDDVQWSDIVSWTVYALFIADEKGIRSTNVNEFVTGAVADEETKLLLGRVDGFANQFGLDREAFRRAIEQVGSYSEIFGKTLRPHGIDVGQNTSPESFGLLFAPPIRIGE